MTRASNLTNLQNQVDKARKNTNLSGGFKLRPAQKDNNKDRSSIAESLNDDNNLESQLEEEIEQNNSQYIYDYNSNNGSI